jgi:HlyD family secretion protein
MKSGPRPGALLRSSLGSLVLIACVAALVALLPQWRGAAAGAGAGVRPEESTSPPAGPGPAPGPGARTEVHALAQLAPDAGIVTVGARPGVRIERIMVKEGDEVTAGAALAVLEGHAQAELQVALAEAQKKSADYQRAISRDKLAVEREREDRLKKDQLDTHERLVEVAKQRLKAATDVYQKIGKPLQDNPAKRHELDLGFYQAQSDSNKAELELKEVQVSQDLIARRRAVEDRQLVDSGPDIDVLERQIDLARAALDVTTVHAPTAGRVLEIPAHAGEVSTGPLLVIGDLSTMVAIAEVYQADVPEIRLGDPAEVMIHRKPVEGKVTRINRMVGKNTLSSLDPGALQDRRVVGVVIRLKDHAVAADYVNMEVEVTIKLHRGGGSR